MSVPSQDPERTNMEHLGHQTADPAVNGDTKHVARDDSEKEGMENTARDTSVTDGPSSDLEKATTEHGELNVSCIGLRGTSVD